MIKKRYLKKWCENLLYIIDSILIILVFTEHQDITIMTIKNIICLSFIAIITNILNKYSRGIDNE